MLMRSLSLISVEYKQENKMGDWTKPRTVFALMFYTSFLYLVTIRGVNPPEYLIGIVNLLMGFYFGQKSKEKTS